MASSDEKVGLFQDFDTSVCSRFVWVCFAHDVEYIYISHPVLYRHDCSLCDRIVSAKWKTRRHLCFCFEFVFMDQRTVPLRRAPGSAIAAATNTTGNTGTIEKRTKRLKRGL